MHAPLDSIRSVSPQTLRPAEVRDVTMVEPAPHERTSQPPPAPLIHTIGVTIGIVLPFAGLIAAMVISWRRGWLDWTQLAILFVGQLLTALGLTLGYHRLLTHRSFSTYRWVRAFWMMMGALALQKSPVEWCAAHRKHHALSDKPGDPHSPHDHPPGFMNFLRGFWHAHVGWILTGHIISTDHVRYVPDLLADPVAMAIHRTWEIVWFPLTFIIPTLVAWGITGTADGALLGFLWGGCVRVFLVQHITFSVNSICHLFGRRDYHSNDESRNNFVCGILSAGEGFHNNHHAFPTSARHGLEWWQPDLTWYVIRLMEMTGLAWDVKLPAPELLESKRLLPEKSPR
ncbi:acyl-CoA desaturase [Planctomicrobium sp. SH661]|uniref:acyl-CoA desaturase n=1 Tax=Planctomicrobium sp. SH661 TaxID=3448124 RepID=UPI003F5B996C